jgi:hypothetical protein
MPLLDHFHPPLATNRPWQGFHNAWATTLAGQLNHDLLPPRCFAVPNVQFGGNGQVDVWPWSLELGQELPVLPLWLSIDLAVPLNLEQAYMTACDTLRIVQP